MSRLGRSSPIQAVIVRNPAVPAGGVTYDVTGGGISGLVGSGAAAADYSTAGTGISALVGSGAASATLSASGTGISPLVGSGAASAIRSATGTGISALVGSGVGAATISASGGGASALVGSGSAQATLSVAGTGISALVGSGGAAVEPFVPPTPVPAGGGDAWAGTGERPYLRRPPTRKPMKRQRVAVPRDQKRTQRLARQAAKAPEPLTFVPAPEIRIPEYAYHEPVEAPMEPIASGEFGDTFPSEWAEEEEFLLLGVL